MPVYWATRNPYAAHNFAMLLAFLLSATGMYYLVRHLTGDRRAAAVAAIGFAFCPYVFAHTAHIQLLMTAGLPFSMLAFHRLADRPTAGRGAALGAAMAAQAICCGYYGVFVCLMVGFAVVVVAADAAAVDDRALLDRDWRSRRSSRSLLVTPAFLPYLALQRDGGFRRELDGRDAVLGELERLPGELVVRARLDAAVTCRRGRKCRFPGFVIDVFGVCGRLGGARASGAASCCCSMAG